MELSQIKKIYKAVFYSRSSTSTMINEVRTVKENARKVQANSIPQVPILIFGSNGEGTGWNANDWVRYQQEYLAKVDEAIYIKLDCPHYVHDHEYVKISEEIKHYLSEMN